MRQVLPTSFTGSSPFFTRARTAFTPTPRNAAVSFKVKSSLSKVGIGGLRFLVIARGIRERVGDKQTDLGQREVDLYGL